MKYMILFSTLVLLACKEAPKTAENLKEKAVRIAKKYVLVDGHIDVPHKLVERWRDISVEDSTMNFDYVKAKKGGIDAPFMSIYVGRDFQKKGEGSQSENFKGGAFEHANKLIDLVERVEKEHPDKFKIARTPQEIRDNFKKGIISLPMGMENGAPIEGDLKKLDHLFNRGIRYVTLTHSRWNHICDSSYDKEKKWNGLSPFGETVVKKLNELGCFIDISHVSDSTFYDVLKLTKAPVIASHSSCRKFTASFERNMSDDMIKALAKNDGVIMINFGSTFISERSRKYGGFFWDQETFITDSLKRKYGESGFATLDKSILEKEAEGIRQSTQFYATLEETVDHIDHVVKLVGINHVGLGSDYDGVGNSLPIGLKDASTYPHLIEELLKRNYSEADIAKLMGENVLRIWEKVIEVSETLKKH